MATTKNLTYDFATPKAKKAIVLFFIKLAILFTVWHLFYNFLLAPGRIVDRPLTNTIAAATTKCLNGLSRSTNTISWVEAKDNRSSTLIQNNHSVFVIADNCNGIQLMFTYLSVIALLPYPLKRKIIFGTIGIAAILCANIIRVCALYFIYTYNRSVFDFSHHYLFTILMDILIFYGWLLFIKHKKTV